MINRFFKILALIKLIKWSIILKIGQVCHCIKIAKITLKLTLINLENFVPNKHIF